MENIKLTIVLILAIALKIIQLPFWVLLRVLCTVQALIRILVVITNATMEALKTEFNNSQNNIYGKSNE